VRAALESISYQLRDAFEAMSADAAVSLAAVHCDGGPTANRFLMQFTADMTGAELRVAQMADCSALGAARAGLLGLGLISSLAALTVQPRVEVIYNPKADRARAERLAQGWRHAVRQTLLTPV
jgi:glycerol kinase